MKTRVINIHHKVPYDVNISRASEWGNPYSHMDNTKAIYKVGSRDEAVEAYGFWILKQKHLLMKLRDLKGKTLGCFCDPAMCHGHLLAVMADDYEYWEEYANRMFA